MDNWEGRGSLAQDTKVIIQSEVLRGMLCALEYHRFHRVILQYLDLLLGF